MLHRAQVGWTDVFDILVAAVGTGGTITGVGEVLKARKPGVRVVAVDTVGSVYAYYKQHGALPPKDQIHQYLIDGIGEDFK